jgi:hypothetical protein
LWRIASAVSGAEGEIMSDSVVIRHAWYEGDHPARRRTLSGRLCAGEDGFGVRSWHGAIVFPWETITRIEVRAPEAVQERHTWTRDLLLPWPANNFLLKKIKAAEIMVSTKDGTFFVLIDHAEPDWVRERLSSWIERHGLRHGHEPVIRGDS